MCKIGPIELGAPIDEESTGGAGCVWLGSGCGGAAVAAGGVAKGEGEWEGRSTAA